MMNSQCESCKQPLVCPACGAMQKSLSPRHQKIYMLSAVYGMTQIEVAMICGVSQSAVSQALHKIKLLHPELFHEKYKEQRVRCSGF